MTILGRSSRISEKTMQRLSAEIFDEVMPDDIFTGTSLVGRLPSIEHLAPKTQRDYILFTLRELARRSTPENPLVTKWGGRWLCGHMEINHTEVRE